MPVRLLLLNPPVFNASFITWNFPSNGLGVLSAYLRQEGCSFVCDDLLAKFKKRGHLQKHLFNPFHKKETQEDDFFEILPDCVRYLNHGERSIRIDKLLKEVFQCMDSSPGRYDLIGFSIHSVFQYFFGLLLAREIKNRWGKRILLGGPFITLLEGLFFDRFSFVDYQILGDGEVGLVRLLSVLSKNSQSLHSVPGLVFRENGTIRFNRPVQLSIHKKKAPWFDKKRVLRHYAGRILPYQTQRGCNGRCAFCTHHHFGAGLEEKEVERVVSDLKMLQSQYRIKHFFFCDATINADYERIKKLCEAIIKERVHITWGGLARAKDIDKELARLLVRAGCRFMRFGIEVGNDLSMQRLRKPLSIANAVASLKNAHDEGIYTRVQFIVGTPHETQHDVEEMIGFIERYAPWMDEIFCVPFYLEHNAPMQRDPQKYGITNIRSLYADIFDGRPEALDSYSHYLDLRKAYAFDEIDGMKWADKISAERERRTRVIGIIERLSKKGKII